MNFFDWLESKGKLVLYESLLDITTHYIDYLSNRLIATEELEKLREKYELEQLLLEYRRSDKIEI